MSAAKEAYDKSRYEQARRDIRREVEAELHQQFNETAPVQLMDLARRAVEALEAIALNTQSRMQP